MQATYEPYILSKFGENLTLIQEVIKFRVPSTLKVASLEHLSPNRETYVIREHDTSMAGI